MFATRAALGPATVGPRAVSIADGRALFRDVASVGTPSNGLSPARRRTPRSNCTLSQYSGSPPGLNSVQPSETRR